MHNQKAFLISAAVALLAAGGLTLFTAAGPLPVLGSFPLLPAVLLMAVLGMVAISYLVHRDVPCAEPPTAMLPLVARVAGLGALLAIPPILTNKLQTRTKPNRLRQNSISRVARLAVSFLLAIANRQKHASAAIIHTTANTVLWRCSIVDMGTSPKIRASQY